MRVESPVDRHFRREVVGLHDLVRQHPRFDFLVADVGEHLRSSIAFPKGISNCAKANWNCQTTLFYDQNLRTQLADELIWQSFVKRAGHGLFQIHVAVRKNYAGFLRMPEMTVGLVVEIGIIRFQIQIIKFLEHRIPR